MHKLIILRGIQGSGKTTWAKAWVNKLPESRVRFNMDDIRNMFGKYWVPSREKLVKAMQSSFLNLAMCEGYDIVLDNMNLSERTISDLENFVLNFNAWAGKEYPDMHYEIEYKTFFDTPLEECIARDAKREHPIGKYVITDTYNRYKDVINGNI